jgi:hypothetical protein
MVITLTTDFGYHDPFVGIMKGVIAAINPKVQVIDLTHGVPAQNVMAGALILQHSVRYFTAGTVHVVVVDPGVGSVRKPILVEHEDNYFVGPDNGVLSLALDDKAPLITTWNGSAIHFTAATSSRRLPRTYPSASPQVLLANH